MSFLRYGFRTAVGDLYALPDTLIVESDSLGEVANRPGHQALDGSGEWLWENTTSRVPGVITLKGEIIADTPRSLFVYRLELEELITQAVEFYTLHGFVGVDEGAISFAHVKGGVSSLAALTFWPEASQWKPSDELGLLLGVSEAAFVMPWQWIGF